MSGDCCGGCGAGYGGAGPCPACAKAERGLADFFGPDIATLKARVTELEAMIRDRSQGVLAEREACAKLVEDWLAAPDQGTNLAELIRARGQA